MKLLVRLLLVLMMLVSPFAVMADETSDQESGSKQSTEGSKQTTEGGAKKPVTAEEEEPEPEPECE